MGVEFFESYSILKRVDFIVGILVFFFVIVVFRFGDWVFVVRVDLIYVLEYFCEVVFFSIVWKGYYIKKKILGNFTSIVRD